MLTDPNMSMADFAEKFGGVDLQPWQRELIERLQRAIERGEKVYLDLYPRRGQLPKEPGYRPLQGGWLEKNDVTGEVTERTWERRDEWQR